MVSYPNDFDFAFEVTIGLEGPRSNDPNDPGGFTIWGLAQTYHPWVNPKTTKDEAKVEYFKSYWPQAYDYQFPWNIVLFDSAVNPQNDPKLPGAGNQELLLLSPQSWQEYQLLRIERYYRRSKDIYVKGHILRVCRLNERIRAEIDRRKGLING